MCWSNQNAVLVALWTLAPSSHKKGPGRRALGPLPSPVAYVGWRVTHGTWDWDPPDYSIATVHVSLDGKEDEQISPDCFRRVAHPATRSVNGGLAKMKPAVTYTRWASKPCENHASRHVASRELQPTYACKCMRWQLLFAPDASKNTYADSPCAHQPTLHAHAREHTPCCSNNPHPKNER